MSSTSNQSQPPSAEEQAYFQAVETIFVRLRGAPLLLSPADWKVAQRWHREGIPLTLIEEVLQEVFAQRKESGRKGKIQSLRYCASAVNSAWGEIVDLQSSGRRQVPSTLPVASRLTSLAAALPAKLPDRDEWGKRIRALKGDSAAVERDLAELDRELLDQLLSQLTADEREALERELDARVAVLAKRLPREEVELARQHLARQLLRRRWGLPVLSLFSSAT